VKGRYSYDPYRYPSDPLRYCTLCRGKLSMAAVDGRRRKVCGGCEYVYYRNPVPVAACLVIDRRDRILLVKRGVEPAKGAWSLPCGFMELGETPSAAALRELYEETGVRGRVVGVHGVYYEASHRYDTLVVAAFRITPMTQGVKAGDDAEDVAYFPLDRMPRLGLATHRRVLGDYRRRG